MEESDTSLYIMQVSASGRQSGGRGGAGVLTSVDYRRKIVLDGANEVLI